MSLRREYSVPKNGVKLAAWRRTPDDGSYPVLLLVHGSSLSALPTFDLQVPGRPDYSMIDWFAAQGFDVWTFDHEGYGASTITETNADIATGVEDLKAVVEFIRDETGVDSVSLYGLSSGSLRAAGFAQAQPSSVRHLVLDGFVWTGEGAPTLARRREGLDFFRSHHRRPIDRDFIRGIFTRDMDGTTDPAVADSCAEAQLSFGDSVPTGTYLDMTANLPIVDPTRITASTLIIRGEHDGIATVEDIVAFFTHLPSADKQITMLPDTAHVPPLGYQRHKMWTAVRDFLRR